MATLPPPTHLLSWLFSPEIFLTVTTSLLFFLATKLYLRHSIPIDWPILRMLPGLLANFYRVHDFATDILEASGCTFLLKGPRGASMTLLLTADPANVNYVFNSNFANFPKGSDFAEIFDVLGRGIFNADRDEWKRQRKITHGLMAEQRFRRYVYETSRRKLEDGLLPILEKTADGNENVDIQDLFLRFTFDTASILLIGEDPLCLTPSLPEVPFAKAIEEVEEIGAIRHVLPISFWKLLRRLNLLHEKRYSQACRTIDTFVSSHISNRKESIHKTFEDPTAQYQPNNSPDILSSLLHQDEPQFKSDGFLRDTVVNLMFAGRDTTAAGLSWFFWLVCSHRRVQDKILEELREHGTSPSVVPEIEELGKMVYLHAALLESLRLYPPVPFQHKQAVTDDVLPSGHRVTPETRLIVSLYAMGRMEGVWGKDCREFRPERWINEKGRLRYEPAYKFLAFNSGPRTCLGKDIALMQMKAAAASVLRSFEMEVVKGHRLWPKPSILLHMKNGMKVRVRRRI